jgi:hypothetical protein
MAPLLPTPKGVNANFGSKWVYGSMGGSGAGSAAWNRQNPVPLPSLKRKFQSAVNAINDIRRWTKIRKGNPGILRPIIIPSLPTNNQYDETIRTGGLPHKTDDDYYYYTYDKVTDPVTHRTDIIRTKHLRGKDEL